jgi:DNA mismatch repair protein MutS2
MDGAGRPTYRLEYGRPGFSAGLSMARTLGLDPALVQKAESYLDEEERRLRVLAQELEQERDQARADRERMVYLQEELAEAVARTRQTEERLRREREELIRTLQQEGTETVARAEAEFRRILMVLRRRDRFGGREITAFHEAKARLRTDLPRPARPQAPPENLKIGDRVRIHSLGAVGAVIKQDPEQGRVEIDVDGRLVKTQLADLAPMQGGRADQSRRSGTAVSPFSFSAPPHELNLIGQSVDEALPQVDKLIDQAQVRGFSRLSVIHGKGTGRLREAIRSFIKADARVKNFHSESQQSGGDGVTIIELAE